MFMWSSVKAAEEREEAAGDGTGVRFSVFHRVQTYQCYHCYDSYCYYGIFDVWYLRVNRIS